MDSLSCMYVLFFLFFGSYRLCNFSSAAVTIITHTTHEFSLTSFYFARHLNQIDENSNSSNCLDRKQHYTELRWQHLSHAQSLQHVSIGLVICLLQVDFCHACLHLLFKNSGSLNKSQIDNKRLNMLQIYEVDHSNRQPQPPTDSLEGFTPVLCLFCMCVCVCHCLKDREGDSC